MQMLSSLSMTARFFHTFLSRRGESFSWHPLAEKAHISVFYPFSFWLPGVEHDRLVAPQGHLEGIRSVAKVLRAGLSF
jgi:hypothetical protein